MSVDLVMVGHISKDIMIYKGGIEDRFTGGAVVYSSIAAAKSGRTVRVYTSASAEEETSLDVMRKEGVEVVRLPSEKTTSIKNIYLDEKQERRDVTLLSQAEPFRTDDFNDAEGRIFHLAGLFNGEIPDDFIPFFAKKGEVGVDAQGLLRCSEDGVMLFRKWDRGEELFPLITYFKTDAAEAEIMTGSSDRKEAAGILASYGAREVMVTHNNEVLVLADGEFYRAPYNPSNLSGRTGRGDTTFAAYMAKRLEAGPHESVWYAAALCSMKMESPGPFSGTPEDVYKRMKKMGY